MAFAEAVHLPRRTAKTNDVRDIFGLFFDWNVMLHLFELSIHVPGARVNPPGYCVLAESSNDYVYKQTARK